jgi:transposase InsO family protein
VRRTKCGPGTLPSWRARTEGQRGVYYHLYVMIDIFSRCAVHFEVHATELGELAKDFMTEAVRLNSGIAPLAIHADRGTAMTSKTVSALLSDLAAGTLAGAGQALVRLPPAGHGEHAGSPAAPAAMAGSQLVSQSAME